MAVRTRKPPDIAEGVAQAAAAKARSSVFLTRWNYRKREVVAVGPGKLNDDGKRAAMDVKEGDRVLVGKYSGSEIKLDGTDYVILREEEILAVVGSNGSK